MPVLAVLPDGSYLSQNARACSLVHPCWSIGSTLRNLGRFDEAVPVLRQADEQFPGHDSVAEFLALALTSAGRCREAVARLINLALDRVGGEDLEHYQRALREYAAELPG